MRGISMETKVYIKRGYKSVVQNGSYNRNKRVDMGVAKEGGDRGADDWK
jgi:hypothetical protein